VKLCVLGMTVVLLAGPAVADKLDDTFQSLKDAVGKKDATQVKAVVAELSPMIREATAAPAPSGDDARKAWADHVEYVKSIGEYCEYALYATAIQSPPATTVDLIGTLEQLNPSSKYLNMAYGQYLVALSKTGATAKIPAIAEKALVHFPDNEDLLSVSMESALSAKQSDRALNYAERLIAAMGKASRPENVPEAQWEHERSATLGRAHWVAGMVYCEKQTYGPGDRELRAALPLIAGNTAMMAPALFYLGMANYQLGKMTMSKAKMLEAVKFSQQAAAIAGPYEQQARHNAIVMKEEADRMR